jgi:PAS domain-containing protein
MRHDPIRAESITVSATHFVRHFSELRRNAERGPVYIENHGKAGWALLSAALLDSMVRGDGGDAQALEAQLRLDALMDSLVARVLLLDAQLRLIRANPAARRHFAIGDEALNMPIGTVLSPAIAEQVSDAAVRTRSSGTSEIFEADSTRYPGRAQRITTACVPRGTVVILEDLGDPGASRDLGGQLAAIRAAFGAIPRAGFGTVNLRGTIDGADPSLAMLSGAPLGQLTGTRLGTLFDMATRARVNDLVERALEQGEAGSGAAHLLANGGIPVETVVGLAPRSGRHGIDGASFVIFARPEEISA